MKESNFLSLGMKDFLHGLLMAVLTPIVGVIQQSIQNNYTLTIDWKHIGGLALAGGAGYLIKKFMEGGKTNA